MALKVENVTAWVTVVDDAPVFNLRWSRVEGATEYKIYKKIEPATSYSLLDDGITDTHYEDTGAADQVAYYYVTAVVGSETEASNIVFAFHFFNYNYAKDLKVIIMTKLKSIEEVVDTVGTNIFAAYQQNDIKYPCVAFAINEYSVNSGNRKLKDITVTIQVLSRNKEDFDKLKTAVMRISGFSYQSKEVKLHKLIEIGGKAEALDPQDNVTWFIEFSFKGKIEIINL